MKYRALSSTGDYTFGLSAVNFLANSPECVAQAVQTRLLLAKGEWFTDIIDGTDYAKILGKTNRVIADQEIKTRILNTPGVKSIDSYTSSVTDRNLQVTATITTIYGVTLVTVSL